jgi:hypothetical protein
VLDAPSAGDRFGFALAVADIDCDTYPDLIVGTPLEDAGSIADIGLVQMVWGSAAALGLGGAAGADRSVRLRPDVGGW